MLPPLLLLLCSALAQSAFVWNAANIAQAHSPAPLPPHIPGHQNCRELPTTGPSCNGTYFDGTVVTFVNDKRNNACCYIPFEHTLFVVLRTWLSAEHSYIGFGTWVGPMLLYAAGIARHAWGMDADYKAYEMLQANIRLNPRLVQQITTKLWCVAARQQEMVMFGSSPGSSSSSLHIKTQYRPKVQKWSVNCSTLPEFVFANKIPSPYFIKMDCEGCEWQALPAIEAWVKTQSPRPTMWLSTHDVGSAAKNKGNAALFCERKLRLSNLFKYKFVVTDRSTTLKRLDISGFTAKTHCAPLDFLFTDTPPPPDVWTVE